MTFRKKPGAADRVRELAQQGVLSKHWEAADDNARRRLRAGAVEIICPLVFNQLTRRFEQGRRHPLCVRGIQWLEPDCLDRFHDDVDAVVDYLFAHADLPIENLQGWLTMILVRATVDAHRRRRGARGAPQRPRITVWLRQALGDDPWLTELATAILEWAGVEATAGGGLWPVSAWVDRRAARTGEHTGDERAVNRDIETVLAAMRQRPRWYERNVEGPLGRKQPALWLAPRSADGAPLEPEPLVLIAPHERQTTLLRELAGAAIDAIRERVRRGDPPEQVVSDVLNTVFGTLPASYELHSPPGVDEINPDRVLALIADPARLAQVVAEVLDLLLHEDPDAATPPA